MSISAFASIETKSAGGMLVRVSTVIEGLVSLVIEALVSLVIEGKGSVVMKERL